MLTRFFERSGHAKLLLVCLRGEGVGVQISEPDGVKIGVRRFAELDRDVCFEPRDISRVHCAAKLHGQEPMRLCERQKLWQHPISAKAFRDRHTYSTS